MGLFRYNWLPFGISSVSGIFLRIIESILQSIPNILVYLDDIIITGSTEELHLETLGEYFRRVEKRKVHFLRLPRSISWLQNRCTRIGPHARKSESSNGCTSAHNSY